VSAKPELTSVSTATDAPPPPFGDKHRFLFEGKHWSVFLYRNQKYLGRCAVYLKTRAIEDPLELTDAEREELWNEILPKLVRALNAAFHPDRINYAHLANRLHHVHWHVVPRYTEQRSYEFAGHGFSDKRRGKIFRTKRYRVPKQVREQIYARLRKELDKPAGSTSP
jgi:diadenosine tetraphosphate (Ap4A) HIT family hydrolase